MGNRTTYKYVAVVGIDGMGVFNKKTPTPCMDKIFENGAVTYEALSMSPTISAQNWGAMLIGANPEVHGLTNSIVGRYPYVNAELPSVFKRIREKMPDASLIACCHWGAIPHGMIEEDAGVEKISVGDDAPLADEIVKQVAKKPTFLFVQFDDVDGAGHGSGYGSEEYLKKITFTDGLVGKVHDAYRDAGILDDTLFVVITDHGGIRVGHGGYTDEEKYVFMAASGKYVEKGSIGNAYTKDISAIVLHALGLDVPEYTAGGFSSQVPDGIFPETKGSYYVVPAKVQEFESRPTPDFRGEGGLASFIDEDRIKLALFMDNREVDATGKNKLKEVGLVKHYSEGVYGARGEFGTTGHVVAEDLKFGDDNYSFAVWFKIDRTIDECLPIFSTKEWYWRVRCKHGLGIALRANDLVFNLGTPTDGDALELNVGFPEDISDGWLHAIVTIDRTNSEIRFYYNFKLAFRTFIEPEFNCCVDNQPFTVGDDTTGEFAAKYGLIINLDDFIVFGDALSEEDVAKLAEYYDYKG